MPSPLRAEAVGAQLAQDFGIPTPKQKFRHAVNARDDWNEVTPLHRNVAADRIAELIGNGFDQDDACVILLMRGARIEAVADAMSQDVDHLAGGLKARVANTPDLDTLYAEAQKVIRLWDWA